MKLSSTQKRISYILKAIVSLSAIIGTFLSAYAGRHSFMGGRQVFMFFTIQSNIAMAIICLLGLIFIYKNRPAGIAWQIIKFVGTTSITLTGIVFCFVLAPTMGASAWNIQNILTHVVVPVVSIVDFFLVSSIFNIGNRSLIFVVVPPILYVIYAAIGYVKGWEFVEGYNYPYFFLNWGSKAGAFGFSHELPFMGTAWWIVVLSIFLILVGRLYLFIAGKINKRSHIMD